MALCFAPRGRFRPRTPFVERGGTLCRNQASFLYELCGADRAPLPQSEADGPLKVLSSARIGVWRRVRDEIGGILHRIPDSGERICRTCASCALDRCRCQLKKLGGAGADTSLKFRDYRLLSYPRAHADFCTTCRTRKSLATVTRHSQPTSPLTGAVLTPARSAHPGLDSAAHRYGASPQTRRGSPRPPMVHSAPGLRVRVAGSAAREVSCHALMLCKPSSPR